MTDDQLRVGECFFWYWLIRVIPDKIQSAVKRLCVYVLANDLVIVTLYMLTAN